MQRSEDEKMAAPGATVRTVRQYLRKRVVTAQREVARLVRLALGEHLSPPVKNRADRGTGPER